MRNRTHAATELSGEIHNGGVTRVANRPNQTRRQIAVLLGLLTVCFAAAGIGAQITSQSVNGWYQTLRKPEWTPPDWVFGPVWTVLYGLMAVAA